MARRNISLPDTLDEQARRERLNVSSLAQRALVEELDRRRRMAALDAWLGELDELHGPPSADAVANAESWFGSSTAVGGRREQNVTRNPGKPRKKGKPRQQGTQRRSAVRAKRTAG